MMYRCSICDEEYESAYEWGDCPECELVIQEDILEMDKERILAPDAKLRIESWVLEMLWDNYPAGAVRNQLAVREMAGAIRMWKNNE
jgi:hypothetical protein